MKFFHCGTALEFQREVASLLGLSSVHSAAELRRALLATHPQLLDWYDARMRGFTVAADKPSNPVATLH